VHPVPDPLNFFFLLVPGIEPGRRWRMKVNRSKSIHVTFITRRETCPHLHINNVQLIQGKDVKYLGSQTHFTKRKQLGITLTKIYSLLGRKAKLSTSNKLLMYKIILKPIWTYGIQLWGTASTSNIEILEHFQSKALRMIVDAPWYVSNKVIRRDLQIPTVKDEIRRYTSAHTQIT
jgi:hypothetical protein